MSASKAAGVRFARVSVRTYCSREKRPALWNAAIFTISALSSSSVTPIPSAAARCCMRRSLTRRSITWSCTRKERSISSLKRSRKSWRYCSTVAR